MLTSEIATQAKATDDTNQFVLDCLGLKQDGHIQYMVMKCEYAGEEIYVALAGGEIVDNEVNFSPVGTGAYEALSSLPGDEIELYALSDDDDILVQQVPAIIAQHKTGSRLCFISTTLVERQDQIMAAFALDSSQQLAA